MMYKALEYLVLAHLMISTTPKPVAILIIAKIDQSPTMTHGKTTAIATRAVMILVRIETTVALLSSFG